MQLQNRDEEGKKMFLRINYWQNVYGWVGIFCGSISAIFVIWTTYVNQSESSNGLHDSIVPVTVTIIMTTLLFAVMGFALYVYYFVKTAAHLGIKFSLQKSIRGIYKEMEQVAKEKRWI